MTATYADRVQETFTTTGTGTISLGGAATGYQAFSAAVANAGTCYYAATDGTNWEVGLGTYTSAGNTLARTTILASSNANAAVSWSAGTKTIWLDLPASVMGNIGAATPAFKNLLIGGDFNTNPWQRGTSFTSINTTPTYAADRWFGLAGSSALETVSQVTSTGLANLPTALRVQRPNANTNTTPHRICQIVESKSVVPAQSQSVTLSFYARAGSNFSATSNNLSVKVTTGTTADEGSTTFASGFTGAASPVNATQAITTSWVQYTFTGTIASGALELAVDIGFTPVGTASTNDYFDIAGVQLEIGGTATAFENLPVDAVLQRCLRYFWRAIGSNAIGQSQFPGQADTTTSANFIARHPVIMRASPSGSNSGTIGNFKARDANASVAATALSYGAFIIDTQTTTVTMTTAGSLTAGHGLILELASSNNTMDFSAEL